MDSSIDTENSYQLPADCLNKRHRYRWLVDGEIANLDVIICIADEWPSHPESASPLWSPWFHGGLVIAARLPEGLRRRTA